MKQIGFKELANLAVITTKDIIGKKSWISYVTHDTWDGSWQFLDTIMSEKNITDAVVVSLQEIIDLDPNILELADLPLGWCAWRDANGPSWHRTNLQDSKK